MSLRDIGALGRRDHLHQLSERRARVVVVPADDLRLDERIRGQLALLDVLEELRVEKKFVANLPASRAAWIMPVSE